tara:strand:- start:743 stop:1015 length:273 start_codon:yes stop_codon:yes gene_type:complete
MLKIERSELVSKILDKHYPETPVPLDHNSVYTLLIAVLLSAQCTDERVNKITPKLFKMANRQKKCQKFHNKKYTTLLSLVDLALKNQKLY